MLVLLAAECYNEDDYYYTEDEILAELTVDISDNSVPADGNSIIKFTYALPVEYDTTLTTLHLKTSNGKFLESDTSFLTTNFSKIDPSDILRYVEVNLISSTIPSSSIVTASLLNYQKIEIVEFYKAYPSSITSSIDPFYIRNNTINEALITSSLSSDNGIASKGTPVYIDFPREHGIIDLDSSLSNIEGVAEFHFVFTDTSFIGNIDFTTWTWSEDGASISTSSRLQVID